MSRKPMDQPAPHRSTWRSAIAGLGVLAAFGGSLVCAVPAAAAAPTPNPVVAISPTDTSAQILEKAATLTPSRRQLAWQREELTGFVHFGPNTFTGVEWGSGKENPNVFNPTDLDTDQWMATFKDAGFKKLVFTAKHHDGMLMFQSAYSRHGVSSSAWMNGQGDVFKSFTDSARKYGIKVGVYLSPADGHEFETRTTTGTYGNGSTPKATRIPSIGGGNGTVFDFTADDYNRYYMNTLYELLTKYGSISEVWLDGANPWADQVTQNYNFADWVKMIRTLQPDAAIFQDRGPDVRWVGNEEGLTQRASEWSTLPYNTDYADKPADPATAADTMLNVPDGNSDLNLGNDAQLTRQSNGSSAWRLLRWQPAECDGRLQAPNWFWHPGTTPVSLGTLQNMYYGSVGKNCQLLLNVAPDNTGRMPADAVTRMHEFGQWIKALHAVNYAAGATAGNDTGTTNTNGNNPANVLDTDDATAWQPTGTTGGLVLDLGSPKTFNTVDLQENLQVGQRVRSFAVDTWNGTSWQQAGNSTTIGHRRLLKLSNKVTTSKVRLRITGSRALPPAISTFALYMDGTGTNLALGRPATQSSTLDTTRSTADRAVDGNTNGNYFAGSVTHTTDKPLDTNPWWQVDLGSSQYVDSIKLWNRTDCCSGRLHDFYVFTSDTPFTSTDPDVTKTQAGVRNTYRATAVGSTLTLPVGQSARYIRVQLVGSDRPLSLAEVQVLG
ncbi:alpha-L-fucosidase [Streptomyces melanogenes]|uniref:alpha-L-fucosidase n=1 Tax=Streptomyces melanogenes TaxID=67326 RepID=UPI00167DC18A|nr:alpha-L-fucosidase [Streptomyces melanogenes]